MAGDPSFRRALRYVRPYAGRLVLVLLLSTSSTALSLVLPLLSRDLVDVALLGRDADALLRIIGIFAAITLVTFGVNAAAGLMYTRASAELLFDMRLDVYRHLQRLSPRFFARMPLGQIVSRINADIGEIQRVIGEAALAWLGHVVVLAGTIGFLVYLDWRLFLVSLAMVPPALWALVVYRRRLEVAVRRMRERSADIGTFLIESLRGIRVVVGFNAQEREARRFRRANDAFIDALMAMRKLTYLSGGLPGLLLAFGTSIVFLYGGSRVISGAMTMGTLVAFVTYQMRLLGPVQGLMGLYANLATARVSLHRVAEIFDAVPDVVESPTPVSIPVGEGDVEFRGVTVGFGRGGPVLAGVDLHARPGETIAIVGRSGEGKSTIADLVTRHLDPDEGCILFDGTDLRMLRLDDVRRHIGVVEQEPFIFNTSLAENIRFSRPDARNDEVAAVARGAGLEALLDTLPEGLETAVGEAGRALSAGERQRVAIARALLADPRVLVLDEATASLDPATEGAVISGYEAAMRGRTTLVITHRRAMAMRADRVVVLDRGRVVENGVPRDLAQGTGPFSRLFPAEERA